MNPARLSAALAGLLPPGAVAAELREPGDPRLLLVAEAAHLGAAVPKRAQEFAAGRLCARRALAEFGIVDFPVRAADDRSPIWPDSLVGSITHTAGFCAAVVAERRRVQGIGLDSEAVGDVNAEIWPRICGALEIAWLQSLPASERAAGAALIFSAKEAFYKCQYPMVGQRLNFHDVNVEAAAWGGSSGAFQVRALRTIAVSARTVLPLEGRYHFHEGLVSAGIGVAAA
jgi:4'-phosphopantetheinyl transferase EntD